MEKYRPECYTLATERGGFVGQVPAWGLYRLLKALQGKKGSRRLDLQVSGGRLSLGLKSGHPLYATTDILHMTFGAYLASAKLIPDDAVGEIETGSNPLNGPGCRRLLEQGRTTPEQVRQFNESHVRSVLSVVLPAPITDWKLVSDDPCDPDCGCEGVDPGPELMRAVAQFPRPDSLRPMVTRFLSGGPFFLAKGGESMLTHAKTHLGESRILFLVRQGRCREVDEGILSDETSLRILFGLNVAGVLTREAISDAAPRATGDGNGEVLRELRDKVKELEPLNHYEVLGVGIDARVSTVDTAWADMRRRFARARFEEMRIAEVDDHLNAIHSKLDQARAILNDRERRTAYNRSLDATSPSLEARLSQMFDARDVWRSGMALMQERKGKEALLRFEEALRQDPDEPTFKVSIANALLSSPAEGDSLERAETLLSEVLDSNDRMVDAHIAMATLYRLRRDGEKSSEHVRKALRLEPDNEEARRLKELLKAQTKPSKMSFQKKKSESVVEKLVSRFRRRK